MNVLPVPPGPSMKNRPSLPEVMIVRIWETIVHKRFTRLLKDDIDFLKGEALDLFVIRIRNMELCLQSITTVIGEASEVMFI